MALDMERPIQNKESPEKHSQSSSGGSSNLGSLGSFYQRRHTDGDRHRSSSPEEDCSGRRIELRPSDPTQPAQEKLLKFSIDQILSPDFGKTRKGDQVRVGQSIRENSRSGNSEQSSKTVLFPWLYCTRYSDRPSSGPRLRRIKKKDKKPDEKRPRTAFSAEQLQRLKQEFQENRYLTEKRRQDLARDLKLNESQIKIWFQNKRAKQKKASGKLNPLALQLMAQGLYNHSTLPIRDEDEDERPSSSS